MQLRTILVGELENYLLSEQYRNTEILPITKQRVASQINNPRALPSDPALILAEEANGNVLGFIGLLPDLIFTTEQTKVFWISCWWVHATMGKALGIPLLLAAHKVSNGLLLADSIPETISVFQKSRLFVVPEPKQGLKLFLKPLLKSVLIRRGFFNSGSIIPGIIDKLFGIAFYPMEAFRKIVAKMPAEVIVREGIPTVNGSPKNLSLFNRDTETLNWIAAYPWLLNKEEKQDSRQYPFSRSAKDFRNFTIASKEESKDLFLYITVRDGVAKLAYAQTNPENLNLATTSLLAFLFQKNIKEFISFHAEINSALKSKTLPFCIKHQTKYQYVWGKQMPEISTNQFQYGDGDAIFT